MRRRPLVLRRVESLSKKETIYIANKIIAIDVGLIEKDSVEPLKHRYFLLKKRRAFLNTFSSQAYQF